MGITFYKKYREICLEKKRILRVVIQNPRKTMDCAILVLKVRVTDPTKFHANGLEKKGINKQIQKGEVGYVFAYAQMGDVGLELAPGIY